MTDRESPPPQCFICELSVSSDDCVVPSAAALAKLKQCSVDRRDGKHSLLRAHSKLILHRTCRQSYTRPSNVRAAIESWKKRRTTGFTSTGRISPLKTTRSTGPPPTPSNSFDFKNVCFFCDERFSKKKNTSPNLRKVLSGGFKDEIIRIGSARDDKWAREVVGRISLANLRTEEASYHRKCFLAFRKIPVDMGAPAHRPASSDVSLAMDVVYQWIEENDDCQFAIRDLQEMVAEVCSIEISKRTLKRKLLERYGDQILLGYANRKVSIVCFRSHAGRIISEQWYQDQMKLEDEGEKERQIMIKAAQIVRKHVENRKYDHTTYPSSYGFFDDVQEMIPQPLQVFLQHVAGEKNKVNKRKKCTMISHCIISLIKPNSFISPLLLGIGSYIHQNFGSKTLIALLSNLGICASYHDVKTLEASLIMGPAPVIKEGSFEQFVFDNCDFNVNTIDGNGTFHNMAGIACVTPADSILNRKGRIEKSRTTSIPQQKKGMVQIQPVPFKPFGGLQELVINNIDNILVPSDGSPSPHDVTWFIAKFLGLEGVPGWQGFLEQITSTGYSEISTVLPMPFIMAPPSDQATVYTSLLMAVEHGEKIGLRTIFVTFDLPLYMKALEITLSAPKESLMQKVVVRIGGFHLLMSFLGTIGYIMGDSGLRELFEIVYAENTVKHIMSGHAYSRAVRAHNLVATALFNVVLNDAKLSPHELDAVKNVMSEFHIMPPSKEEIDSDPKIVAIQRKVVDKMKIIENRGPTAKLWVQYLNMVILIRQFIEAERTGQWEMHLSTVRLMVPFFIVSGHIHYAKACLVYLQQMLTLQERMTPDDYARFTGGYFTVRRSNKFCSGTSTDMVIEQTANREFKVKGGIVQRGFTDDVISAYVLRKPAMAMITEALEDFSGRAFVTSEQHIDARESRIKKDKYDIDKLQERLELINPFVIPSEVVISLGTGIKGTDKINCHMAKEMGEKLMIQYVGKKFADIKMKKADKVLSLAAVNSFIKVNEKIINIDPLVLYQRMLLWRSPADDLKEYFRFELSPFPMSLFTVSGMRKNVKSQLYEELITAPDNELEKSSCYVIDGGNLLHSVRWDKSKCSTYSDVCDVYVNFLIEKYKDKTVVVVFDGYDDPNSIKESEHRRRYKHFAPDFTITATTPTYANQEQFLSSTVNKKQLIDLLSQKLSINNIEVVKCEGDADLPIVEAAIAKSGRYITTIVSQDIDVLVIAIARVSPTFPVLFLKPRKSRTGRKVFNTKTLQEQHEHLKDFILLAHAFGGCDTTSAIHGKGKKQVFMLLRSMPNLVEVWKAFSKPKAKHEEIASAGERLFLNLYGAKDETSLDALRFGMFEKSLKKTIVKLESLPPTSASAAQHSYRVYLQVQQWRGEQLRPEDWGWRRQEGTLVPIRTTLDPAPDAILREISCACRRGCATQKCGCVRTGVSCSPLCKFCEGVTCDNTTRPEQETAPVYSSSNSEGEASDEE